MRASRGEILRRRQQCHDLRSEGKTRRQIMDAMDVNRSTLRDWLNLPRPTDEDITTARPANSSISPAQTLLNRQRCHDLHAEGMTNRLLQQELNASSVTIRNWLARPRPSDGAVEAARKEHASLKPDSTGQVPFKSRFDPELFARLRAEAEAQGAATNRVLGCAARLYLDCMERARAGSQEPVHILGYRA